MLLWNQTYVLLTALFHYCRETVNPESQLKHTQAFILKIPIIKTQGVSALSGVKLHTFDIFNESCQEEQHASHV